MPTLSVRENVRLPFELAGRGSTPRSDGGSTTWSQTLGLADRVAHRPSELSGGQQQRVAIARALASRPAVIFADEPTGNLDSRSSREVLTLLRTAAREYGQTIAMVSHDPVAASYADRILVIADGRIVADQVRCHPSRSPSCSSASRSVRHDAAQPHPRVAARARHGRPRGRAVRDVCRDAHHDLDRPRGDGLHRTTAGPHAGLFLSIVSGVFILIALYVGAVVMSTASPRSSPDGCTTSPCCGCSVPAAATCAGRSCAAR